MEKKRISAAIKEAWLYLKSFCLITWDGLRLDFAIMMADALQRARNKRFYVLDNGHGKLIWLCNDDIKQMQRPRIIRKVIDGRLRKFKVRLIPKGTTHMDVMRDCFYYTAESKNNSNGITVEERNVRSKKWIRYMEKVRYDRMMGKLKMK